MTAGTTALERTVAALRTDVLTGELRPGDQLIQETIAERHGVSRIPVREALQALASEGLVSYYPNRGYFVTELSATDLIEVYRLRRLLETEAIEHAVPMLTDADIEHLRELSAAVDQAAAGHDLVRLTEANRAFHFALFECAGMPRMTKLLRQLWDASDVYRSLYFQQPTNRDRVSREHEQMLQALADRDVAETIRMHDLHRDHSVEWVTSAIARSRTDNQPYQARRES